MGSNINLCTLNVRGLSNRIKRKCLFRDLIINKFDVCLLQETHGIQDSEKMWRSEWGGRIHFGHGDSNARGVAILLGNRFSGTVTDIAQGSEGRYLILKVKIDTYEIVIINVYAPNRDSPEFFQAVIDDMLKQNGD